MEAQETPTPQRRRKVSVLWIIPLLVVVALGVDNGLLFLRDAQAKAASATMQAQLPAGEQCGGNCGAKGGGCGMMGGAKTSADAKGACPAHKTIEAKEGQKTTAAAGGCPMMKPGAATKATAGKSCPMVQPGSVTKPGAGAGMSGCPMMKSGVAAKTAASTGKCPAGSSCGMKPGAACASGGNGSCSTGAASGATKPSAAGKTTTATYVCPMCAGVKSDKPGNCPKCGMALVKQGS
jgi:hypothetical protein